MYRDNNSPTARSLNLIELFGKCKAKERRKKNYDAMISLQYSLQWFY